MKMAVKVKVADWEKSVGYGTHRVCSECGNVTRIGTWYYRKYECSAKKAECGSGTVKPSHSCVCWKERVSAHLNQQKKEGE
jgi:hypothetical protein